MSLRLGVAGERISYSLSPVIFNWACNATGVAANYRVYELTPAEFESLVQTRARWDGLNVTVPHKTRAMELCDRLSREARIIGAVNTLRLKDGLVIGSNTDVFGFGFVLEQHAPIVRRARRALVIGSGGAARAVLAALGRYARHLSVTIGSRNPEEAAAKLSPQLTPGALRLADSARAELPEYDLVIQATPVGSAICPGLPLCQPLRFRQGALVIDLVYAPRETAFLTAAREQGCTVENGLTMLIAQASQSFEQWTSREFPLERAMRELRTVLESQ